jgi:hypothetical protein
MSLTKSCRCPHHRLDVEQRYAPQRRRYLRAVADTEDEEVLPGARRVVAVEVTYRIELL